jgi:hypothetical protein
MSEFVRRLLYMVGVLLVFGTSLKAQENLDSGKTPAQLYASDCAVCHKSPQGLAARGGGMLGLESFLREHYTASRESAAAIAGYLRAAGNAPAAGRTAKGKGKKGDDKAKGTEKKPDEAKSGDAKSGDVKSGEGKPGDAKAVTAKPAEAKPAKPKSSEPKAAAPKPAESGKPN